jgi:hypothetical protein
MDGDELKQVLKSGNWRLVACEDPDDNDRVWAEFEFIGDEDD